MRCPVLVGRASELAALTAAVGRAGDGHGEWIAVLGEAGMGKTRLLAQFAEGLRRSTGVQPVVGRASGVDRSTPYRALAEAVLDLAATVPLPVPDGIAPYAAALARFVPPWRSPESLTSESPAVLGESLLRLLRWRASRSGAAVVVFEDLHWADPGTLAVCEYVADHVVDAPVVAVATARPDEAGSSLHALARAQTVRLRPLTPDQVAQVAEGCLGEPPTATVLDRLAAAANGLPLLVEDLLDGDARMPLRYAALVAERLGRVPASAVPVVVAAALLGERFELPLLVAAAPAGVTEALDAAIAAGLMVADEGTIRFRHALTHEAVLDAAPAARSELAVPVAAALEATGDPSDLARAAVLRVATGDTAAAVVLYERAAADAPPATALSLLDRAADLASDRGSRLRIDRARLTRLAALGRPAAVDALGNRLLDALTGEDERAVRLTLAAANLDAGRPAAAAGHLEAVGAARRDDPTVLLLRARLALQTAAGDRRLVAEHFAHQAIAASHDHAATACEALELAARCARSRSLDDAAALLQRALTIAEGSALTPWRLRVLNELGTVEMLRRADGSRLERALAAARAAGALDVAAGTAVNIAALHAMRGELAATAVQARAAHDEALRLGLRPLAAAALVMEAVSYGFRGDRDEMERRLRAARELAPDDADLDAFAWGAGRGLCALVREEREKAVGALTRAVQEDVPAGSLDTARAPRLLVLEVEGRASDGDRRAAQATATPGAGWSDLWLGYAQAVAAGRAGDRHGAAATYEGADEAARRHPLFRAIGLRLVADAAIAGGWGHPVEWLREAESTFVAGGQTRIAAACRALLKNAGVPVTRRRGADRGLPDHLLRAGVTAREAEVLALVGERLPNKEIAARLYLSPRTVEKHVANLLLKLGAADRVALARLAAEAETSPPRMGA